MSNTTTVRVSIETRAKLERLASITGWSFSKTLDFAKVAEEKVDEYHGNRDSLLD